MNPALAMPSIAAAFAVLMLGAVALRRSAMLGSEGTRKFLHVGMGIVTLSFPWLFQQVWPVLALTGGFVSLLLALRYVPALRDRYGSILCGVGRTSWGEVYFPVAVGTSFTIAHTEPVYYVVPILILTFADAAAALIGKAFGRHRYLADEGEKSWEGSAAFLAVAFACASVPLIVAGWQPLHALLAAFCIATVAALLEATAWRGLDNLFVPLSSLAMLRLYQGAPESLLLHHLGGLGILAVLHLLLRRVVLLREGTLLGAFVVVYLCWILGDIHWAYAPIVVLASHRLFAIGAPAGSQTILHAHHALLAFGLPSLCWLFAHRLLGANSFVPFNVAFGAHIALTAVSQWRTAFRPRGWVLLPLAVAIAWLLLVLPLWLLSAKFHYEVDSVMAVSIAGLFAFVATGFHVLQPRLQSHPVLHWVTRAGLATLASLATF